MLWKSRYHKALAYIYGFSKSQSLLPEGQRGLGVLWAPDCPFSPLALTLPETPLPCALFIAAQHWHILASDISLHTTKIVYVCVEAGEWAVIYVSWSWNTMLADCARYIDKQIFMVDFSIICNGSVLFQLNSRTAKSRIPRLSIKKIVTSTRELDVHAFPVLSH